MKRILHIANFNSLRLKGCFQCGFPIKISYGLIKNGYEVINYADRDLCRMFGFGHMNWLGRKKLNNHLVNFAKVVNPDAILIGHADTITNDSLFAIKEMFPHAPIMQWNCDPIYEGCNRNIKAITKRLEVVDSTVISTADKSQLEAFRFEGKPIGHMPNMVDKAIETGTTFAQENLDYDVFYAATTPKREFCGKQTIVEEIIDNSFDKIPDIKWLLAGLKEKPTLNGFEYLNAFRQSAMGLSLSRRNDVYLYASDRLAHIMGNGQMALIDKRGGFEDILGKETAGYYSTPDEFYDQIKFFKQNPQARMKVAKNGYDAYYREFNNELVTKYMADILFGTFKGPQRDWQIVVK